LLRLHQEIVSRGPYSASLGSGGRVPGDGFGRPHLISRGGSAHRSNSFARRLFAGLPERYDVLAEVLSFGQNRRWRKALVNEVVAQQPALIADVATGTCAVACELAARTGAWVAGLDISEPMLRRGRHNVVKRNQLTRIGLVVGRAESLPFPNGYFDALSFTYLLRYVEDPQSTMNELARVVRPQGTIAGLEFNVPEKRLWRLGWWLYTRGLLPLAGALLGGPAWFRVGRFLGPSISFHYRSYPLEWTVDAWRRAGLVDVCLRRMSLGAGVVMWGTRRGG
jgi:demethylmenaquinone methyltransferase/2-methoxy-6-polyprenyl-1,4-benzoquinol methylase